MQSLKANKPQLVWIKSFISANKVAMLVPQFNEMSNGNFHQRLEYFKSVAEQYVNDLDVIIVDDGSTDGSLEMLIKFVAVNDNAFWVASISPNKNKVGALYTTLLSIDHSFVILSDFDTDLKNLEGLFNCLDSFEPNRSLMGCYFRMLPYGSAGNLFLFQQLEYSMARSCYKLYEREKSVPVMPGAGCCYKSQALLDIYSKHSGLRNGEDREATLIGLHLGYNTCYLEEVLSLTRPPKSFKALIKQRVRWNLGYMETFHKERFYYYCQVIKLSGIGLRTVFDFLRVLFILLIPFAFALTPFVNRNLFFLSIGIVYVASAFWSVNAMLVSPKESVEFKSKRIQAILMYPLYKVPLDFISWSLAIWSFFKQYKRAAKIKYRVPITAHAD